MPWLPVPLVVKNGSKIFACTSGVTATVYSHVLSQDEIAAAEVWDAEPERMFAFVCTRLTKILECY